LEKLTVFGKDYATRDGTAIRDYIHVVDVARGHLDALAWMRKQLEAAKAAGGATGLLEYFNFGTGTGSTVLELVAALEKASGKKVPMVIGPARAGDVPAAYANIEKVRRASAAPLTHSGELTHTHTTVFCRRAACWAGARSTPSTTARGTHGTGRAKTRAGTRCR